MPQVPTRLYKYRSFGSGALSALVSGEVYYAPPSAFNDPLDCKPQANNDLPRDRAEHLYQVLQRARGVTNATDRLMMLFNQHVNELEDMLYTREEIYLRRLGEEILRLGVESHQQRGVYALAERYDCPLLWSHYADNHQGVCLEYATDEHALIDLKPAEYDLSRVIAVSTLYDWLVSGSHASGRIIDRQFFAAKAPDWSYEREWRVIHPTTGIGAAPYRLSGVYFGLRCPESVRVAVLKIFAQHPHNVMIAEIQTLPGGFGLHAVMWAGQYREQREAFSVRPWFLPEHARSPVYVNEDQLQKA